MQQIKEASFKAFSETLIEDAGFSARAVHVLRRNRCKTLQDVIACGTKKILGTRCCGYGTICEIAAKIKEHGYDLPGFEALMRMDQKKVKNNKHKALRYLP